MEALPQFSLQRLAITPTSNLMSHQLKGTLIRILYRITWTYDAHNIKHEAEIHPSLKYSRNLYTGHLKNRNMRKELWVV